MNSWTVIVAVSMVSMAAVVDVHGQDTWAFEPRTDAFKGDCLLDLRFLNEKVAGESGWMYAKDGKPLKESGKILVQAVTDATLTGWKTSPVQTDSTVAAASRDKKHQAVKLPADARKIEAIGKPPFQVERVKATITFKTRSIGKATALDLYGYADSGQTVETKEAGGSATVVLPAATYFTILQPSSKSAQTIRK